MNAMRLNAMRWKFAARGFVAMWMATIAVTATQSTQSTELARTIAFPKDYRSWQHVRSIVVGPGHKSFTARGGIHHYYANALAVEGYRTGRFPNGSIIVDEGVLTEDGPGLMKGITVEGNRRTVEMMVKNDQLYAESGGWGFEKFEGQESTGRLDAKGRTECFECHAKSKDKDYVFTRIRVPTFAQLPPSGTMK